MITFSIIDIVGIAAFIGIMVLVFSSMRDLREGLYVVHQDVQVIRQDVDSLKEDLRRVSSIAFEAGRANLLYRDVNRLWPRVTVVETLWSKRFVLLKMDPHFVASYIARLHKDVCTPFQFSSLNV